MSIINFGDKRIELAKTFWVARLGSGLKVCGVDRDFHYQENYFPGSLEFGVPV